MGPTVNDCRYVAYVRHGRGQMRRSSSPGMGHISDCLSVLRAAELEADEAELRRIDEIKRLMRQEGWDT